MTFWITCEGKKYFMDFIIACDIYISLPSRSIYFYLQVSTKLTDLNFSLKIDQGLLLSRRSRVENENESRTCISEVYRNCGALDTQ